MKSHTFKAPCVKPVKLGTISVPLPLDAMMPIAYLTKAETDANTARQRDMEFLKDIKQSDPRRG